MRRVAVTMFKGGVGKSTVAVNVAVGLARRGRRVALIDLDGSGNATTVLGHQDHGTAGMYGVIQGEAMPSEIAIEVEDHLTLYPSNKALALIDADLAGKPPDLLRDRLKTIKGLDYVIVDTAPGYGLLNRDVLFYVDGLWIPATTDYLSLDGVAQVQEILDVMDKAARPVIKHIIPTFYDGRQRKAQAVLDALQSRYKGLLTPPVRQNVRVSEAAAWHQSIFDYDPRSLGAADFNALIEHIDG